MFFNFRSTPSKADKKDGEEFPGEPITNVEQQLQPGRYVYLTDGLRKGSKRFAAQILETNFAAKECKVVFYTWPRGTKKPRGWTLNPNLEWMVDFHMIHSNLLDPIETFYTKTRNFFIFKQLEYLNVPDEGAL